MALTLEVFSRNFMEVLNYSAESTFKWVKRLGLQMAGELSDE